MIQLGFATAFLPELSLTEVMEFAADVVYDCIEVIVLAAQQGRTAIRGCYAYRCYSTRRCRHRADSPVNQTHRRADQRALGYYPNCLSPNADEANTAVEHLKRVLSAAKKLGWDASIRLLVGITHVVSTTMVKTSRNVAANHGPGRSVRDQGRDRELPDVVFERRMAWREEHRRVTSDLATPVCRSGVKQLGIEFTIRRTWCGSTWITWHRSREFADRFSTST